MKRKWDKIDSDLWHYTPSGDEAIVLAEEGKWWAFVEHSFSVGDFNLKRGFPLTKLGLEEAKGWVEKAWEMVERL